MKVLVTGGAGYIGSTVASALMDEGITPVILDNLVNGRREFTEGRLFYEGDIVDRDLLKKIFTEHHDIEAAIHCAALIVVPDSVIRPYAYYTENVSKSITLFKTLAELGCRRILFSSSASIYDDTPDYKVTEASPLNPRSPYARTKYMMEMILQDFCQAYGLQGIALRYFNPIGADPKMRTGSYIEAPSHLLGKMLSVYEGKEDIFNITGTQWDTRDGTGIRDYLHVWDLALAHVAAIQHFATIFPNNEAGYEVINLGNGQGCTVREMVDAFSRVTGEPLKTREMPPREGDIPGAYADASKAKRLLDWQTTLSIEEGIRDAIAWDQKWVKMKRF